MFVAKLNATSSQYSAPPIWMVRIRCHGYARECCRYGAQSSTYFGGSDDDRLGGVALDSNPGAKY